MNTGIPIIERIASKRNSGELSRAFNVIEKTFDEEMSEEKKRYVVLPGKTFTINPKNMKDQTSFKLYYLDLGVDDKLDEKKRLHNGLPGRFYPFYTSVSISTVDAISLDLMHQVVQEEVEELPDCMTECSMVYVPHVGYMLAVKPWCVFF